MIVYDSKIDNYLKRVKKFNDELDKLLIDNNFYHSAEIFKILTKYLSDKLENIEEANNKKQSRALVRTTMYLLPEYFKQFKKFPEKKKEKELFKLVNLLVIQVTRSQDISYFRVEEEIKEITKYKNNILDNESWYLRFIPESKWLLEYLHNLEQ
jgi:hypothetical protein